MRRLGALVFALLVLAGCTGSGAGGSGFVLAEYTIDVPSTRFGAGPASLEIVNEGEFSHTLVVTAEDGRALGATGTIAPGEAASLQVDLQPGTYHVSCRIVVQLPDGTLVDHYQAGMVATFAVAEG